MSVLLLGPLFELAGGTALATELLGSTIGTIASGAAVGAASGAIDASIKEQLPSSIRNAPTGIKNDYLAAFKSTYMRDPSYLIKNKQSGNSFAASVIKPAPSYQPNKTPAQIFDLVKNDIRYTNVPIIKNGQIDNYQEIYTGLTGTQPYREIDQQQAINDSIDPEATNLIDSSGDNIEETVDLEDEVYAAQYDVKSYSPRDIAQYVIDFSKQFATTLDEKTAIENVLSLNPSLTGLAQKVSTYMTNKALPNTEEFKQIFEVYNGQGITIEGFKKSFNAETGLIEISSRDETGTLITLPQTTGMILPAYPGSVFIGPNSRNNELPTGGLMDMFAFFHDSDYRNGFFDRAGDLKFISRLAQNRDKFTQPKAFVNATIIYFSTVSLTLGALKNNGNSFNASTLNKEQVQDLTIIENDDIFKEVGSPAALELPPVTEVEYGMLKDTFYDIMDSELYEYSLTDGWIQESRTNYAENALLNLEISLN